MDLTESGVLIDVHGDAAARVGTVETDQGAMLVDLRHLPDALPGDLILFHTGIAFRIVGRASLTGASSSGSTAS